MDEREKRWLEKRYRLPEQPQILCHPVPQRSLEKFSCEVMSLSILLDYRPEDTKKHCFEVSFFAELFNEMLMRDFGFNIYKMLSVMPDIETVLEESKDKQDGGQQKGDDGEPNAKRSRNDPSDLNENSRHSKKGDSGKRAEVDRKSESKDKDKNRDRDRDRERDRGKERDRERERDRDRGNRDKRLSRPKDETDEDNTSMRSVDSKRRETKKMVVVDPDLLLSFVYFDQDHCGYIFSNHLEDLFHSLGLMLSRADTKRIITRVGARSLNYR